MMTMMNPYGEKGQKVWNVCKIGRVVGANSGIGRGAMISWILGGLLIGKAKDFFSVDAVE